MINFIGRHIKYHKEGPGSKLIDGGSEIFPPHIVIPYELLSDKHYHVYVKYGYAKAYLSHSSDLETWKNIYETMQKDKGRIPDIQSFNALIQSIRQKGFLAEYAIPIDENYDILDGSHRLATALALNISVYVQMFSKSSKNYEKNRLTSCRRQDFDLIENERHLLLSSKKSPSHSSLMTVWGASLNIWNELLPQIGFSHIKRSFLRNFNQEEYLAYIATVYAGDGISHSSLTRKSWFLEKFRNQAGILLLDLPPEEIQNLKIKIRENFINTVPQYHFDSIVHTVDNIEITPQLISLIEPYKPTGNQPIHKDILSVLKGFLAENIHTTDKYKKAIKTESSMNLADIVNDRIKLVIFDLDGVIVDSEIISAKAYQMLLHDKGIDISLEESCRTFCGLSKKDASQILKKKYFIQFSEIDEKKKKLWICKEKNKMLQVPGIRNIIEKIDCQKCISSGSSFEGIKRSLDIVGLKNLFSDSEIFSTQALSEGKPNPEIFLRIAEKYKVKPDQIMVIEDSLPGIIAANRAQMHYIWYGQASHIRYAYTKDMLIPLTKNDYYRKLENSPAISASMFQLMQAKTAFSK